jgi:hypothetical protein
MFLERQQKCPKDAKDSLKFIQPWIYLPTHNNTTYPKIDIVVVNNYYQGIIFLWVFFSNTGKKNFLNEYRSRACKYEICHN